MSKKASKDYIQLRKLLGNGYTPNSINIEINKNDEKATIQLQKEGAKKLTFVSKEGDVVLFAFSVKQVFNKQGESIVGEVSDLGLFYDTLEKFYDPQNKKFQEAVSKIINRETKIEYVPHDLLRRFLEDPATKRYKPYLKLRDDYYIIKILHIEHLKTIHAALTLIRNQKSIKTKIFNTVLDLFRKTYHGEGNFVKNYQLFQKYNKVDPLDLLISTSEELDLNDDKFQMLSMRNGTPAKQGLKYVIESYSSLAESVIKILNIIRAAIEMEDGNPNPAANKKSTENWRQIEQHPKYKFIVEQFDPRIRHGKAHINYSVDVENNVIHFYKESRVKEVSVSYSFEEFKAMWHRLHLLLSALVVAVCVEQAAITGAMFESAEYKMLLAGLGNFKEIKNNHEK